MKEPIKQSVPLILQLALIFWATAALTYTNCKFILEYTIPVCIGLTILIIPLCLFYKHRICLYIAVALLGILISILAAYNLNNFTIDNNNYIFEASEDQKSTSISNYCKAKVNGKSIKIQFDKDVEEVHAGDLIKADAKISDIDEWNDGITKQARLSNAQKLERTDPIGQIYKFRNYLIDTIRSYDESKPEAEQLLNAIVCGQRIDLSESKLYESFKCAGLAHLVAVSGAHLSLVTTMLLLLLRKLRLRRHLIIVIQSIFIFTYLICAAIPISALRAAFMAYVALFSFFSKRRPASLNAIGICIFILIAINPQTSVSISFALSAGSTIGIILFSRLIEFWFRKLPSAISSTLGLTFAANLCSQPLSVSIFTQLPLISPISNIICTPIFTVLCSLGLLSALIPPLLPISYFVSNVMCLIVKFLASIPYASIAVTANTYIAIIVTVLLCFILYFTWPKAKYILVPITCIIAIFIILPNNSTQLVMLDVGQGDSIVMRSQGKTYMIDTGNKENLLKSRLAEQHITHLDGLFITHPDDDHCGCVPTLKNYVQIDNAYIAQGLQDCNCNNCTKLKHNLDTTHIETLNVGDSITFGNIKLDVIWPDSYKDEGGNADSLTMLAYINEDINALLCGDAEYEQIETMQKLNRLHNVDIYKVGHHGSKNALTDKATKMLKPKISLFSVGKKNRYGHPAQTTIDKLESVDSQIYRTDKNGTITLTFNADSIDIKTER
ncbi:MAG: DNA internalization-related competence protein ComEC/Rec2 [Coriobacteriia bacterium]|nr:DNA internalization-related competence protein ComEC/Rec2 [Coriobacteriia bacterium]